FRWDEQRAKDNALFQAILDDSSLREKFFTKEFIEGLEKRKDTLEANVWRVDILLLTMFLLLFVAIAFPSMSISALDLSAKAADFREVLFIVIASLEVYAMLLLIAKAQITDVLHLYVRKQAEGNQAVLRALRMRYGLGTRSITTQNLKDIDLSKWQKMLLIV